MTRRTQGRKFPYYVIEEINAEDRRMYILDLNSIQRREEFEDGKWGSIYVDDEKLHDGKWIDIPGTSKAEKDRTIKWINEMVFPDGEAHPDKYMVYDHRRHNTDPFHEEYKVNVYREFEKQTATVVDEESLEEEEVEESDE